MNRSYRENRLQFQQVPIGRLYYRYCGCQCRKINHHQAAMAIRCDEHRQEPAWGSYLKVGEIFDVALDGTVFYDQLDWALLDLK